MGDFIQHQGALQIVGFSFFFLFLVIGINRLQKTMPSPVNKLLLRWIRLFLVGMLIAVLLKATLLSGIPLWRLWIVGVLFWIVFDSIYLWIFISAWDKSEFPLYPKVRSVDRCDWPANHRFFLIKDWLRANDYNEVGAFRFFFDDQILQQMILFENPARTIRLQIFAIPDPHGLILDQVIFVSNTDKDIRLVTDNLFMPFGGVYPDNWMVQRFPSTRRVDYLADRHLKLINMHASECVVFEDEPLDWIERSQQELENLNIEAGLLHTRQDREEHGKMTGEGRYRIWKELLLLNYFAKGVSG